MYHKVAAPNPRAKLKGHYVSPSLFARQMAALNAMGFQTVPLTGLFDDPSVKRPIAITFDDGYLNFTESALPVLHRYKFAATVFLVSSQLGGTNAWDVAIGDVEERLMDIEQIGAARQAGIDFGSHTTSHANLATADPETAWREISDSRCDLEERLQAPVKCFAYPYGATSPEARAMVERAGYACACSTLKGANDPGTDPFMLKRVNVRRDTSLPVFILKIARGLRLDR